MSSSLQVEERQKHYNTRIISGQYTTLSNDQRFVNDNNDNIKTIANIQENIITGKTHYTVYTTDYNTYEWYVLDSVQASPQMYRTLFKPQTIYRTVSWKLGKH